MRRFPLALAIVPASIAVHLLLAACGGADTSTAQAGPGAGGSGGAASSTGASAGSTGGSTTTAGVTSGSGSGGAVPVCDCSPKPPVVMTVKCAADDHNNLIAELPVLNASVNDLARVEAIGLFSQMNDQFGSVIYSHQRAPVLITDGQVAVNCKFTPNYPPFAEVRFFLPAQ